MQEKYTFPSTRTPNQSFASFDDILIDGLLAQHGGRNRLRLISDEELYRARLALMREEASASEWLHDYDLATAAHRAIAVSAARHQIELEEQRRQRASNAGVPRDPTGGWVPETVINAIRDRLRPSDLVQRWGLADIRERPRNSGKWSGLCPFHADDSPSFYVYDGDDPHFHCFGCGAHGDVFDLARLHTGRNFQECCEGLAGIVGAPWPPPEPPRPPAKASPKATKPKAGRVVLSPAPGV